MATLINKTEEVMAELEKQGKVHLMNTPEDYAMIKRIDDYMEEVRRDFLYKSARSEIEAAKIILD